MSLNKHLRREDVLAYSWGLALKIRWSKTIQFRERELLVPLPHLPGHPLDPTQAIRKAFQVTAKAPAGGPAFVFPGSLASFTPTKFATMLNTALKKLGLDPSAYSGHSFRRGGGGGGGGGVLPGPWKTIYLQMPSNYLATGSLMLTWLILKSHSSPE